MNLFQNENFVVFYNTINLHTGIHLVEFKYIENK